MAEGSVLEHGLLQRMTEVTPQGGVVSPLLANIYLHHVLDANIPGLFSSRPFEAF